MDGNEFPRSIVVPVQDNRRMQAMLQQLYRRFRISDEEKVARALRRALDYACRLHSKGMMSRRERRHTTRQHASQFERTGILPLYVVHACQWRDGIRGLPWKT